MYSSDIIRFITCVFIKLLLLYLGASRRSVVSSRCVVCSCRSYASINESMTCPHASSYGLLYTSNRLHKITNISLSHTYLCGVHSSSGHRYWERVWDSGEVLWTWYRQVYPHGALGEKGLLIMMMRAMTTTMMISLWSGLWWWEWWYNFSLVYMSFSDLITDTSLQEHWVYEAGARDGVHHRAYPHRR